MPYTSAVRPRIGTLGANVHASFAAHVRTFLPFDHFSLWTTENEGRSLVITYRESAQIQAFPLGEAYPIEETLARYLDGSGASLIRSDLASIADPDLRAAERTARDAGLRCMGMVPLMVESDVVGLLHVFSTKPHAYTLADLAPLALLAPLVTTALQSARAQDRAERLAREAEARAADLALSRGWLHSVLTQIPHGVLVVDTEGRVALTNPAIARVAPDVPAIGTLLSDIHAGYEILGDAGTAEPASRATPLDRALAGELVRPTRVALRRSETARAIRREHWLSLSM